MGSSLMLRDTMSRILVHFLAVLLVCGCARRGTGLSSLDEARRAAEDFWLHADADAVLQHIESGVTSEEERGIRNFAKGWKVAKLRDHPDRAETHTLADFEKVWERFRKDWPVKAPYEPKRWSHTPEIVFVFHFAIKDEKEPVSGMYFVGAYQRSGLWYFAKIK